MLPKYYSKKIIGYQSTVYLDLQIKNNNHLPTGMPTTSANNCTI